MVQFPHSDFLPLREVVDLCCCFCYNFVLSVVLVPDFFDFYYFFGRHFEKMKNNFVKMMKVDYVVDPVPVPVPVPFSDALHVADFPLRSMKQQILVLRRRTTRIQKVKVVIFQRLDVAFLTLRLTNFVISWIVAVFVVADVAAVDVEWVVVAYYQLNCFVNCYGFVRRRNCLVFLPSC
jgi:hypothetical protein